MALSDHLDPAVAAPHLPRREALRKLALLGIAACASGPLLAACGTPASQSSTPPAPTVAPPNPMDLPGRDPDTPTGSNVTFAGPSGPLHGSWAAPDGTAKGAVLVLHDDQGLTSHFSDVVGRFAGAGYATLCVDLLSGPSDPAPGSDQAAHALTTLPPAKLFAGLRAGIVELRRRAPGVKIGAAGFGFGAGALWQLLGAGDPILAAAVPFYGPTPDKVDFSRSHAAILALYPENDRKLGESQDNADMAMMQANLVHNSVLFQNADTGFFDDTGDHFNAAAADKAWRATLAWFNQYLVAPPKAAVAVPASAGAPKARPTTTPKPRRTLEPSASATPR